MPPTFAKSGLRKAPVAPADDLRETLDAYSGQVRLHELRQEYDGTAFDTAVVQLVESGEIALFPVGDCVHVRREN
jgi:hypothetical protein